VSHEPVEVEVPGSFCPPTSTVNALPDVVQE